MQQKARITSPPSGIRHSSSHQPLLFVSCSRRTLTERHGISAARPYAPHARNTSIPRLELLFSRATIPAPYRTAQIIMFTSVNIQYSLRRERPLNCAYFCHAITNHSINASSHPVLEVPRSLHDLLCGRQQNFGAEPAITAPGRRPPPGRYSGPFRLAMNSRRPDLLAPALERLRKEFSSLPEPALDVPGMEGAAAVLEEAAARLGDNYPYFHPLYAGQMLKPPHPVAQAAYALAMTLNPNNHALDGGRASSRMEVEAVREIAAMFGWSQFLGHLTSGGTFANLEALWVAGQMAPGKKILASDQAHYTHSRIGAVLKLPYASVATDDRGRMDLAALESALALGDVGTVVATLGTTAVG